MLLFAPLCYNAGVSYTYMITIPLKMQIEALEERRNSTTEKSAT